MPKQILLLVLILWIAFLPGTAAAVKYKGDLETNESVTFPEQSSKPANPPSAKHKIYFRDDGALYHLDSAGQENPVLRAGLKNAIINGGFDLWQRATSVTFSSINGYNSADRFRFFTTGSGTMDISRQAFTPGQTDVPGEPEYYFRLAFTSKGTVTVFRIFHRIEDVRTFAGQTATLSFWAKASTSFSALGSLKQNFGTGGSPSAEVTSGLGSYTINTTWTRYVFTIPINSISGKTLGTNNNDFLAVEIGVDSLADGATFDLANMQIEKGSVATAFEKRPPLLRQFLAERYYRLLGKGMAGGWASASIVTLGTVFGSPMRTACTLAIKDTTPVVHEVGVGDKTGSSSTIFDSSVSADGMFVRINGFTGATTGNPAVSKEEAILTCDSEL